MLDWNLSSYEKNVLSLSVSYIMQSKQSNHEIKNPDEREWGYKLQEIKFQGFHYFKLKKQKANKQKNKQNQQPWNCRIWIYIQQLLPIKF